MHSIASGGANANLARALWDYLQATEEPHGDLVAFQDAFDNATSLADLNSLIPTAVTHDTTKATGGTLSDGRLHMEQRAIDRTLTSDGTLADMIRGTFNGLANGSLKYASGSVITTIPASLTQGMAKDEIATVELLFPDGFAQVTLAMDADNETAPTVTPTPSDGATTPTATPGATASPTSTTKTTPGTPKTGDTTNVLPYVLLALVAVAAVVVVIIRRNKKQDPK